jgi:hypothetical protein
VSLSLLYNKIPDSLLVVSTRVRTQDSECGTLRKNWCQVCARSCCRPSPRAVHSTSSRREFVLAGHLGNTAQQHLPGLLGTRRSLETKERIPSTADGGCIALAAIGRAVHAPRRPASWVKLCPDHRPHPRPIGEINRCLWDLP